MVNNVIVTGGSRGIGLGLVKQLAQSGFRALALARSSSGELDAAIALAPGDEAGQPMIAFDACDLADLNGLESQVKQLRRRFGPIYGLVNNAGSSIDGPLALTSVEQIEQLVRINTVAPIVLTKAVIRTMMADNVRGRIVNISSIIASTGYQGLSVYAATKASLVGFTRSLAREVGRLGITVNAVAPGFVATALTESMTEDQREKIKRRSALQRLVDIDDVAGSVQYLLSDAAKNITGTVLTVDAGSTA